MRSGPPPNAVLPHAPWACHVCRGAAGAGCAAGSRTGHGHGHFGTFRLGTALNVTGPSPKPRRANHFATPAPRKRRLRARFRSGPRDAGESWRRHHSGAARHADAAALLCPVGGCRRGLCVPRAVVRPAKLTQQWHGELHCRAPWVGWGGAGWGHKPPAAVAAFRFGAPGVGWDGLRLGWSPSSSCPPGPHSRPNHGCAKTRAPI